MRIAQIAPLSTPVRPIGAGSIEGIVWLLTRELARRGHEVTVFAAPGSEVHGQVRSPVPGTYGSGGAPDDWHLCEWMSVAAAFRASAEFDVIHSHNYLFGIPLDGLASAPMVHTLHVMPDASSERLRLLHPDAVVTAISRFQWSEYPHLETPVIPHAADADAFLDGTELGAGYACYLGRFTPDKGVLRALDTAEALGLPIVLAGPENAYYRTHVEPRVDGVKVRFLGAIGGRVRAELLARASVLLYPLAAPEPFGLVMVEAMLSATPVAAIAIGAVPEIVEHGVTGACSEGPDGFADAARIAVGLDRRQVRLAARERFRAEVMADRYMAAYEGLVR